MFNRFARENYGDACHKGFFDKMLEVVESQAGINKQHAYNAFLCQQLMGVTSELAEAYEALRKGDRHGFDEEVIDAMIRLLSLCGCAKINVDAEISKKMSKNRQRPRLHGKIF